MNFIHPTAIISSNVKMGSNNTIGPFVVLSGPLTIGNGNWIGAGAIIGAPAEVRSVAHPSDLDAYNDGSGITIGNGNVIREAVQIHQGWQNKTLIGSDCFIMNQAYVAHDCVIGDNATIASSALLAGHVELGNNSNIGLGAVIHQRLFIGASSMVGMGALVTRNVPPFVVAYGTPARVQKINSVGMARHGFSEREVARVENHLELSERNVSHYGLDRLSSDRGEIGVAINEWISHTVESN